MFSLIIFGKHNAAIILNYGFKLEVDHFRAALTGFDALGGVYTPTPVEEYIKPTDQIIKINSSLLFTTRIMIAVLVASLIILIV